MANAKYLPAEIDPEKLYSLSRLREFGFGYRLVKDFKDHGGELIFAGRVGYISGRDLIHYIRSRNQTTVGA